MILKDLIAALERADPNHVAPIGFRNPHSYRGYYEELSFSPAPNVTVAQMLDSARDALGSTYHGYHARSEEFMMTENTPCHLAEWGECGETIGPVLLGYMLGTIKPGRTTTD